MRLKKVERALLIVDFQNDFCPGGTLAVAGADKIIPTVNKYLSFFNKKQLPIFLSRDWHPKKSRHFKKFGGLWPVHCVQRTKGAAFHPRLKIPSRAVIVSKGTNPEEDSYSVFQGVIRLKIPFGEYLNKKGIRVLFIGGLATDYCVRATVLDGLKSGFKVIVLKDAIRGVAAETTEQAIAEMKEKGAKFFTFARLVNSLRKHGCDE